MLSILSQGTITGGRVKKRSGLLGLFTNAKVGGAFQISS